MNSWKSLLGSILCLLLSCIPADSSQAQAPAVPTTVQCVLDVGEPEIVNASYSRRLRKIANESRDAAVQVYSADRSVRGSGTYFVVSGHHIIITAAHVIRELPLAQVATEEGEIQLAIVSYVLAGPDQDLAVLLLAEPLQTRAPMELKIARDYGNLVGAPLVYTGYPAHHERLTVFGNVASIEDGHLILHSYTWPGASGSAVFDEKGNLMGVIRAVDVNVGPFGPQITEDIVWVYPARTLDLDKVVKFLEVYKIILEESVE